MRTTVVRDQMKQEGLITGQEHVVGRLQKLNLSETQQPDPVNYEHGCVVVFHKRSRGGFKVGEQWAVSRRDQEGTVIVRRMDLRSRWIWTRPRTLSSTPRQAVCRTGERFVGGGARARCRSLSATDARAHPQHPQPAANLQHDIEPPLRPTLEQKQERGISI
jgi:hypothetical protein